MPSERPAQGFRKGSGLRARKIGYARDRQKGSHIVLRRTEHPHRRIVVPDHREVAKGTLRAIIKQAGLTVEQFSKLL